MRSIGWMFGSIAVCALVLACSSSDTNKAAATVADAGLPEASVSTTRDAAPVDATADAGGSDPLAKPPATTDDFERTDPTGGPLHLLVTPPDDADVDLEACTDTQTCSGNVVVLRGTKDDSGPGAYLASALGSTEAPAPRKVRLDFDLAFSADSSGSVSNTQFAAFQLTHDKSVFVAVSLGSVVVGDAFPDPSGQTDSEQEIAAAVPASDTWARYQLYVDLDALIVEVTVNGVVTKTTLRPEIGAEQLTNACIGLTYFDGTANVSESFDNLGLTFF